MADPGTGTPRDRMAAVLDPEAFDDTFKKSARTVAVLQWAARRHMAYQGSDRILAAFPVLAAEATQPREVEVTDVMVERMARMFFAQTTEARSGFTWPVNGEWGRERDMERARGALVYVLKPPANDRSPP